MTQPDKAEWTKKAGQHNGNPVIWIDQTNAPQLKAANSEGVCFAITLDWVEQYRTSQVARSRFLNSFRDVQAEDPPKHLPAIYIDKQQAYSDELKAQNAAIGKLKQMLVTATESSRPPKSELETILLSVAKHHYGRSVGTVGKLDDDFLGIENTIAALKQAAGQAPGYFMMTFSVPGRGGHVVGFECRSDMYVSPNYPELYEFIDANLGAYAFSKLDDMMDFFYLEVWSDIYLLKNYTRFELAQFDRGAVRAMNRADFEALQ